MAEEISTMILKVDLDCSRCYTKIRKTLCKLQVPQNIKSIAYDEKKKTVTISGPFNPQKLFKMLCCKACECILEMEIVKPQKPSSPPKPPSQTTGTATACPAKRGAQTPTAGAPPPLPPVYMPILPICLAGNVCRCNWNFSCRLCQNGGGGDRPCSCGCGREYRPCRCGCGRGYVRMRGDLPACGGPCYELIRHYETCQVVYEEVPTACIIM